MISLVPRLFFEKGTCVKWNLNLCPTIQMTGTCMPPYCTLKYRSRSEGKHSLASF